MQATGHSHRRQHVKFIDLCKIHNIARICRFRLRGNDGVSFVVVTIYVKLNNDARYPPIAIEVVSDCG